MLAGTNPRKRHTMENSMRMRFLALPAFCSLAVLLTVVPVSAQPTLKCRPADDTSENIIGDLKTWITTTDPERIAARDNIFKIPVVNLSQISVVTDERICGKVIQGYTTMTGGYTPSSVYVIKMGTKYYATHDPARKAGQHSIVHIFDSRYQSIGGWTGG